MLFNFIIDIELTEIISLHNINILILIILSTPSRMEIKISEEVYASITHEYSPNNV